MAQTGQIRYTGGPYGSNEKLVSYNYFTMTYASGSWPTTPFRITSVCCHYTKSDVGYYTTLYKVNSTDGYRLGATGSYWTGTYDMYLDVPTSQSDINTLKSLMPTTAGSSWVIKIYGDGGTAGTLRNGSDMVFTISWELTEMASSFTLANTSVTLVKDGTVASNTATVTTGTTVGYHKIKAEINGSSVFTETTIGTGQADGSQFTYDITGITCDSCAQKITDSKTGTMTVTLTSYSSDDRVIGTATQTVAITVGDTYKPVISSVATTIINGYSSQALRYVSKIKATASASFYSGASAVSYTITGQDLNAIGSSNHATSGVLSKSGSFQYSATVTDSRGYTSASVSSAAVTVKAYIFPFGTLAVNRCNSSGGSDPAGTAIKATLTLNYADSSVVIGNSIAPQLQWKLKTSTTWSTGTAFTITGASPYELVVTSATFEQNQEYDFQVVLKDAVQNAQSSLTYNTLTASIGSAEAFFIFSKKSDKQYFGFGAYPTHTSCVEVHPNWGFYSHGKEIAEWMKEKSDIGASSYNMLNYLKDPKIDAESRVTLNGARLANGDSVIDFQLNTTTAAESAVTVSDHGYRITATGSGCPRITFGSSNFSTQQNVVMPDGMVDPLMGLRPGHSYKFSGHYKVSLYSGATNTTTFYVRLYQYSATSSATAFPSSAASYQTIVSIPQSKRGELLEGDFQVTFMVPTNSAVLYMRVGGNSGSGQKAGDYMELTDMCMEEVFTTPHDIDLLEKGTSYTPTFDVAAQSYSVIKRGDIVHLQYVSEQAALFSYDKLLLTLPTAIHPATVQFIPLFFGSRSDSRIGYGMGKLYTDGTLKIDQFSGLMFADNNGVSTSAGNTCVYINAVYEL